MMLSDQFLVYTASEMSQLSFHCYDDDDDDDDIPNLYSTVYDL